MKINLSIPTELHTRAKVIAVLKGISLNEYFEDAIKIATQKASHRASHKATSSKQGNKMEKK